MESSNSLKILRNIGAVPTAILVWVVGNWFIGDLVMKRLTGDDPDADTIFFIVPIQPLAEWLVPIAQVLILPGLCVAASAAVAVTGKRYFALGNGIAIFVITILTGIMFEVISLRADTEISIWIHLRMWFLILLSWGSASFGVASAFSAYQVHQVNQPASDLPIHPRPAGELDLGGAKVAVPAMDGPGLLHTAFGLAPEGHEYKPGIDHKNFKLAPARGDASKQVLHDRRTPTRAVYDPATGTFSNVGASGNEAIAKAYNNGQDMLSRHRYSQQTANENMAVPANPPAPSVV